MKRPHDERWEAAEEGAELLREGSLEDAKQALERELVEDEENEYAFFFLGSVHYEQGDYPRALKAYLRAAELVPTYRAALVNAGHALRSLGRYEEAIRLGKQLLMGEAHDPDALYLVGLCYFATGELPRAEQYLNHFVTTKPELEPLKEAEAILDIIRQKTDGELSE